MGWRANKRVNDGVLRHRADSKVWKPLDELYPLFAFESRIV